MQRRTPFPSTHPPLTPSPLYNPDCSPHWSCSSRPSSPSTPPSLTPKNCLIATRAVCNPDCLKPGLQTTLELFQMHERIMAINVTAAGRSWGYQDICLRQQHGSGCAQQG